VYVDGHFFDDLRADSLMTAQFWAGVQKNCWWSRSRSNDGPRLALIFSQHRTDRRVNAGFDEPFGEPDRRVWAAARIVVMNHPRQILDPLTVASKLASKLLPG